MNLRALFGTTKLAAAAKVEREERYQEANNHLRELALRRESLRQDLSAAMQQIIKEQNQ